MCSHIATADTPHLRKLLLIKCFTVASMTKIQFKQNTSEKLDFRYCCIESKLNNRKLVCWTKQKNTIAIAESTALRKVGSFHKKGFFFCNCQRGGCWLLTASVVNANSSISLIVFISCTDFRPRKGVTALFWLTHAS